MPSNANLGRIELARSCRIVLASFVSLVIGFVVGKWGASLGISGDGLLDVLCTLTAAYVIGFRLSNRNSHTNSLIELLTSRIQKLLEMSDEIQAHTYFELEANTDRVPLYDYKVKHKLKLLKTEINVIERMTKRFELSSDNISIHISSAMKDHGSIEETYSEPMEDRIVFRDNIDVAVSNIRDHCINLISCMRNVQ